MAETNSSSSYTFFPKFQEYVPLYRGVVRVWIGDGTAGEAGFLYAEYIDGVVTNLGLVSEYNKAKEYFEALGVDLTYQEWIRIILSIPENATSAAASAATATSKATAASNSATSAANSKTAAQTAKTASETAQSKAETAQSKAETARAGAETAEDNSEAWAVGTINGTAVPSSHQNYHNNSKYYSEVAHTEQTAATASKNAAATSESNALSYRNAAQSAKTAAETAKSAAETARTAAQTAQSKAETAQAGAETSEDNAEAWAVGTKNGSAVPSTDSTHHNNSKYYAGLASTSETNASNSATAAAISESNALTYKTAAETAKTAAETAKNQSAQWATGGTSGTPSSTNNSKYYATQASNSKTAAANSASAAAVSETNAADSEDKAALWATGGTSGTPSATNNAKYYSEVASDKADSVKKATVTVTYQNSEYGTVVPTGDWTPAPSPVKSLYMWSKILLTWMDGTTYTFYNVAYIGTDGLGAVNEVNGKAGDVVLYAGDITMSQSDNTSVFDMLQIATTSEIDALFN